MDTSATSLPTGRRSGGDELRSGRSSPQVLLVGARGERVSAHDATTSRVPGETVADCSVRLLGRSEAQGEGCVYYIEQPATVSGERARVTCQKTINNVTHEVLGNLKSNSVTRLKLQVSTANDGWESSRGIMQDRPGVSVLWKKNRWEVVRKGNSSLRNNDGRRRRKESSARMAFQRKLCADGVPQQALRALARVAIPRCSTTP